MSFAERVRRFQEQAAQEKQDQQRKETEEDQADQTRRELIPNDPRFLEMMAIAENAELHEALNMNRARANEQHSRSSQSDEHDLTVELDLENKKNHPAGSIFLKCVFYDDAFGKAGLVLRITWRDEEEKQTSQPYTDRSGGGIFYEGLNAKTGLALELFTRGAPGGAKVFHSLEELLDHLAKKLLEYPYYTSSYEHEETTYENNS